MRELRRHVDRNTRIRSVVHATRTAGGHRTEACTDEGLGPRRAGGLTHPLSSVPSVRKDDEPPELRPAVRHDRRYLQRTWNVSRPRRAASRREVHSRRRVRADAPGGARSHQGRTAAASGAGAAPQPATGRANVNTRIVSTRVREYENSLLKRFARTLVLSCFTSVASGYSASASADPRNVSRAARFVRRAPNNATPDD